MKCQRAFSFDELKPVLLPRTSLSIIYCSYQLAVFWVINIYISCTAFIDHLSNYHSWIVLFNVNNKVPLVTCLSIPDRDERLPLQDVDDRQYKTSVSCCTAIAVNHLKKTNKHRDRVEQNLLWSEHFVLPLVCILGQVSIISSLLFAQ